jgi:hypothetical protein
MLSRALSRETPSELCPVAAGLASVADERIGGYGTGGESWRRDQRVRSRPQISALGAEMRYARRLAS